MDTTYFLINLEMKLNERIVYLKNRVTKIKQLNDVELYIWTYFSDMQNRIDLKFEQLLLDETLGPQAIASIRNDWSEISEKIKSFESECKFAATNNPLIDELKLEMNYKQIFGHQATSRLTEV